jgi:hypothetical protein
VAAVFETNAVVLDEQTTDLVGAFIDAPGAGYVAAADGVDVLGWALGRRARAVAVEVLVGGTPIRRAPLDLRRDDVAAAFPGVPAAGQSGFRTTVDLIRFAGSVELGVRVLLEDGVRVRVGSVHGHRRWGCSVGSPFDSLVSAIVYEGDAGGATAAVASVLAQAYSDLEVLVVGRSPAARAYEGARLVEAGGAGREDAWAAGTRASNGEFLVFLDAHDRLLPEALTVAAAHFAEHPHAAAVVGCGRLLPRPDACARLRTDRLWGRPRAGLPSLRRPGARAATVFRRSAIEHVDTFDRKRPARGPRDLLTLIAQQFPICAHDELVSEHALPADGVPPVRGLETLVRQARAARVRLRGDGRA